VHIRIVYEVMSMKRVTVVNQSIQEKLTFQSVVMVEVNIAYPSIDGDIPRHCIKRFNEYYIREAQKQLRYAKDTMYKGAVSDYKFDQEKGYPFNNYELMQVYEVTYNAVPMLSLYYDTYQYTGGAHGMTERTGNTWDLYRCKLLEMKDLFIRDYDYTQPIFKYIEAEALRRQESGEAQYFEGLMDNIHKYFDEKNFYLSCQGLEVFYPLYSIAPYYVGIQVFTVPYGMFGNNLVYPLIALCT
jgi:hypothetical protein